MGGAGSKEMQGRAKGRAGRGKAGILMGSGRGRRGKVRHTNVGQGKGHGRHSEGWGKLG